VSASTTTASQMNLLISLVFIGHYYYLYFGVASSNKTTKRSWVQDNNLHLDG